MPERIEHMGSYFAAAHHDVTAPSFAVSVRHQQRIAIERGLAQGQMLPRSMVDSVMQGEIGDPSRSVGAPVVAYVNASRWLARCPDCAGCEFVDFLNPVFMCCSCWNASIGGAWRPVTLPTPILRGAVERLLLRRAEANRNFRMDRGETLLRLARENRDNGLDWSVT